MSAPVTDPQLNVQFLSRWHSVRAVVINKTKGASRCLKVGTLGAVVTAVCCFTPILVLGLGIVGLGILIPYLDYLLVPALGLFLVLTVFGLVAKRREK
jgi:protein-S-isoprenylcysteine O-methyltransferase Ste14